MNQQSYYNPFEIIDSIPQSFQPVDSWVPNKEDEVFRTIKGAIILDVSGFYSLAPNPQLDAFILNTKRSYNNPDMRAHTVHYLNYFERFYDMDHELVAIYCKIKYLIDFEPAYTKEAFIYDLKRYIMSGPISMKLDRMNSDNYSLNLTYKNVKNPNLQYSDTHGRIMMKISVLMNCIIPLICHFMFRRDIKNSTEFILEVYDVVINLFDIDVYSKLYETAVSNIMRTAKRNQGIWSMQDIRGINTSTHSIQSVQNVLINIMPKYRYDGNLVHLNYKSILRNTGFQILDIEYEYSFVSLSSSRRDEDLNSEFDKFESFLQKQDESLLVQNWKQFLVVVILRCKLL